MAHPHVHVHHEPVNLFGLSIRRITELTEKDIAELTELGLSNIGGLAQAIHRLGGRLQELNTPKVTIEEEQASSISDKVIAFLRKYYSDHPMTWMFEDWDLDGVIEITSNDTRVQQNPAQGIEPAGTQLWKAVKAFWNADAGKLG